MKVFHSISLSILLLTGLANLAKSALRPWEIYNPEEFSDQDRALVQSLFTERMEERGRGHIAHKFKSLSPEKRNSIVEATIRLRTPNMSWEKITRLMGELSCSTNIDNIRLTVDLTLKLIPILKNKEEPWECLHVLRQLETTDAKENLAKFVCECPLFQTTSTVFPLRGSAFFLMVALSKSPDNEQRQHVITCTEMICGPSSPIKKQVDVVEELVGISSNEEREQLVTSVLKTDLLSIYENEEATILSALKDVLNEKERNSILEFLSNLGFISREITALDFYFLFTSFSKFSASGRQRHLDLILESNILTPTMSTSERVRIINTINHRVRGDKGLGRFGDLFIRVNEIFLRIASSFITQNTTAEDRAKIIQLLNDKGNSFEVKELLVSYASHLCTVNMTSHDRLAILDALADDVDSFIHPEVLRYRFQFASAYLEEATLQGIINEDNIFTWIHAFLVEAKRVGPSWRGSRFEEIRNQCLRTGRPIHVVRGEPIVLGEQARANLPVVNMDVVSQEAITVQRRAIKETYEALATSAETAPLIHKYLPSDGTANDVFVVQATKLMHVLEFLLQTQKLSPVQQMKIINALLSIGILTDQSDIETLSRIKALSPEVHKILGQLTGSDTCTFIPRHGISNISSYRRYSHPGLPNIRQFFALVYNLLDQQMGASSDPKVFTKNWLGETFANNPKAWDVFKKAFEHDFPSIKLPGTIGEALENEPFLADHLTLCLEKNLKGEGVADSISHKDHHKAIRNLVRSYVGAFKERHTALIEALSMIMRGHNENLDSLEETNRPACAEGAYLGLIKVLQEIPDVNQIIGTSLAEIDVVTCAVSGPAAAAPRVSVVSLGEVQESSDQTRTLREEQDVAYAASLVADQERDRLRALEQQMAPETERAESVASAEPEETAAERRERIAAAAEARRAGQN